MWGGAIRAEVGGGYELYCTKESHQHSCTVAACWQINCLSPCASGNVGMSGGRTEAIWFPKQFQYGNITPEQTLLCTGRNHWCQWKPSAHPLLYRCSHIPKSPNSSGYFLECAWPCIKTSQRHLCGVWREMQGAWPTHTHTLPLLTTLGATWYSELTGAWWGRHS